MDESVENQANKIYACMSGMMARNNNNMCNPDVGIYRLYMLHAIIPALPA